MQQKYKATNEVPYNEHYYSMLSKIIKVGKRLLIDWRILKFLKGKESLGGIVYQQR